MFAFSLKKKQLIFIAIIVFIIVFLFDSLVFADSSKSDLDIELELSIGEDGLIKLEDKKNNLTADDTWNELIARYKNVIVGIAAVAALSMLLLFIFKFTKLGTYADNPQQRAEIIRGLWVTGLATALLGSVSLFVYIFYTMLN